jgi:hypothetical protein
MAAPVSCAAAGAATSWTTEAALQNIILVADSAIYMDISYLFIYEMSGWVALPAMINDSPAAHDKSCAQSARH